MSSINISLTKARTTIQYEIKGQQYKTSKKKMEIVKISNRRVPKEVEPVQF